MIIECDRQTEDVNYFILKDVKYFRTITDFPTPSRITIVATSLVTTRTMMGEAQPGCIMSDYLMADSRLWSMLLMREVTTPLSCMKEDLVPCLVLHPSFMHLLM